MKFVNPRILRLKNYERARRVTKIFTLLLCAILGNNLNIVFHVVVHNQFAMFVSQNPEFETILIGSDVFFRCEMFDQEAATRKSSSRFKIPSFIALSSISTSRRTLWRFCSFKIRRTTFLNNVQFVDHRFWGSKIGKELAGLGLSVGEFAKKNFYFFSFLTSSGLSRKCIKKR